VFLTGIFNNQIGGFISSFSDCIDPDAILDCKIRVSGKLAVAKNN